MEREPLTEEELRSLPPELRHQLTQAAVRPKPCAEPLCYASGYTLDLYCDHENGRHGFREFPHQFTGETFAECARSARKRGWQFHYRTRTATCPKCNGSR